MDVRTICLGLLSKEDRSGYEIKKLLEEGPLGHFVDASFGSIYPALTKMTEEGLLEFRTESQDGRPDKKVYSLTELGQSTFTDALAAPIDPDRHRSDFLFVLSFAEYLTAERLERLIEERLAYYDDQIAEIREEMATEQGLGPGALFVGGHALSIFEAAKTYLEQNRHLLVAELNEATKPRALTAAAD